MINVTQNLQTPIFNGQSIAVFEKRIKHMYLHVCQVSGKIEVSVPKGTPLKQIQQFIDKKAHWIQNKWNEVKQSCNVIQKNFTTGTLHYFQGKTYQLHVIEISFMTPCVEIVRGQLIMFLAHGMLTDEKQELIDTWYLRHLEQYIPLFVKKYETLLQIQVSNVHIKKMKTRWGSCTPKAKCIRINLELAKLPLHCLEYVVLHEMVHFLEYRHNKNFKALMCQFMPNWPAYERILRQYIIG